MTASVREEGARYGITLRYRRYSFLYCFQWLSFVESAAGVYSEIWKERLGDLVNIYRQKDGMYQCVNNPCGTYKFIILEQEGCYPTLVPVAAERGGKKLPGRAAVPIPYFSREDQNANGWKFKKRDTGEKGGDGYGEHQYVQRITSARN